MKKPFLQLSKVSISLLFLIPVYGHAQEASSSVIIDTETSAIVDASTTASTTPVQTFTECSQAAIETRDTKIASVRTIYNTAIAKALVTRKNSEKAAIALTDNDEKKDAIKLSVDTYKAQTKAAQTGLVTARKAVWQTFEDDIKKCRELLDDEATTVTAQKENKEMKAVPALRKIEKSDLQEQKTIGESIKAGIENLKSLFN